MKKNDKDVVTYTEDEIRSDPYGFTLKEITKERMGQENIQHTTVHNSENWKQLHTFSCLFWLSPAADFLCLPF